MSYFGFALEQSNKGSPILGNRERERERERIVHFSISCTVKDLHPVEKVLIHGGCHLNSAYGSAWWFYMVVLHGGSAW